MFANAASYSYIEPSHGIRKCEKEAWSSDQEDVIELVKSKMDVAVENRIEGQGDSCRIKQDNKNLM